jgi:hypothetical protein
MERDEEAANEQNRKAGHDHALVSEPLKAGCLPGFIGAERP